MLTLLSADPAEMDSQFPASITIKAQNTSSRTLRYTVEAVVDEGWGTLVLPSELELGAGESEVVFVTMSAPSTQAPGTYDTVVRFVPLDVGMAQVELTARVNISEVENLTIVASVGEHKIYKSDEPVRVGFQLVNMGNSTTSLTLIADVSPKMEFALDSVSASLSPGSTAEVVVELTPPENLGYVTTVRVTLRAVTPSTTELEPAARNSTTVIIMPGETPDLGSMHAVMEGHFTTRLDHRSDALTIQGVGSLQGDLGQGREAAIRATTPSLQNSESSFTTDEQFRATYRDESWGFVDGGNITVNLNSELLPTSLNGFGAQVGLDGDDFGALLSFTEREGRRGEQNTSAQMTLGSPRLNYLQLTMLDQKKSDSGLELPGFGENIKMYSALGHAELAEGWSVEAEAATSEDTLVGSGKAYSLQTRWYQQGFSITGRLIRGERAFLGTWGDTAYHDWNVAFKLSPELRLWGNLSSKRRNVDDDPTYRGDRDERFRYGLDLGLGSDTSLRITKEENSTVDEVQASRDDEESSTSIDLTQKWDGARLSVGTKFTEKQDNFTLENASEQQYSVRGNFEIGDSDTLNLSYTVREEEGYSGESSRNENLSAGVNFEMAEHSDLGFDLRWSNNSQSDNEQLAANMDYNTRFANGHELRFRVLHNFGSFDDTTDVTVEYRIPLSVPMKGFALRASVSGRVFLGSDPTIGIADTMVMIDGKTVVSDQTGAFAFPALEPGLHTLQISAMSLALGVSADPEKLSISTAGTTFSLGSDYGYGLIIPEIAEGEQQIPRDEFEFDPEAKPGWPVHFRTEAGQQIEISLAVKTGASIKGTVYEQDEALPGITPTIHIMPGAILELTGLEVNKFRVSDAAGRFLFTGLPPGTYQLVVRTERLAGFYIAKPKQIELVVEEGQEVSGLDFLVKPAERKLEITEF